MDSYSCTLAQTAIKPDYTTGLLGKTVNLTETEARPFPNGFRRKERVESTNLHFLTHAATQIRDLNFHTGDLFSLAFYIGHTGRDCHLAFTNHRISRVDREIEESLLKLITIGPNISHAGIKIERQSMLAQGIFGGVRDWK